MPTMHKGPIRTPRIQWRQRRKGSLSLELIVSAMLLMLVMGLVTSLSFRIGRIWRNIDRHRIAVNELSNQLERLTLLPEEQIESALESVSPSETCSQRLRGCQLVGKVVPEDWGVRIDLELDWDQSTDGNPVRLSGWIVGTGTGEDRR